MADNRVYGFDFLRGICAIAVAYYHILGWLGASHIKLYNLGLYGVYIFFILSGSSIYIAYAQKILNGYDVRKFLALRLFRLLPLFALVVIIGPYIDYGNFDRYDSTFFQRAIINITFAFGIGNPGEISLATGGWSLGIEFLFYLLFPAILPFVTASAASGLILFLSLFIVQLVYIQYQVVGPGGLSSWSDYIQFASFASYFIAGCLIGRVLVVNSPRTLSAKWQPIIWISFLILCIIIYLSSGGFPESSITGKRGVILPIVCIILALTAGFVLFKDYAKASAAYLGHMSYGMYLLHPLIFTITKKNVPVLIDQHILLSSTVIIIATGSLALVVERYFERPINDYGKRLLRSQSALPQRAKPSDIYSQSKM